jgi:phospholipid transport system substrate-binding protein
VTRDKRFTAALLFAALAVAPAVAQQPDTPARIVSMTSQGLADTIANRYEDFEANAYSLYELIDELLLPRFDFERGGRSILAEHWEPATVAQRQRFSSAFYNYLVASYGDLLIYFDDSTIRTLPAGDDVTDELPVTVNTVLTLNDGTEVDVDFVMINRNGAWKIVDVVAAGISYVRSYRSQFRIQIAEETLESVIEWLEEKAAPRFRNRGARPDEKSQ